MRQRAITGVGLVPYVVAQFLPAFLQEGTRATPGWAATLFAVDGLLEPLYDASFTMSEYELAACLAGTCANVCLLIALIAGFFERRRFTITLSGLALTFGLVSVAAMFGVDEGFLPLVGCAVWLGSMLWLSIGSVFMTHRNSVSTAGGSLG